MKCPKCGGNKFSIQNSNWDDENWVQRRYRKCRIPGCEYKEKTIELITGPEGKIMTKLDQQAI